MRSCGTKWLVLVGCVLLAWSGLAFAVADGVAASESLPNGASSGWLASVRERIRTSEYDVTWAKCALPDVAEAYQAPNRACNLRTYFTPEGIRIVRRAGTGPDWDVGLNVARFGFSAAGKERALALGMAELRVEGNRAEYLRPGLVEWYVNDDRGLEQGFTIDEIDAVADQPSSVVPEEVVLDLAITGNCRASGAGSVIEIRAPGGDLVMNYGGLHANDAAGRALVSRLAFLPPQTDEAGNLNGHAAGAIRIVVDTSNAVFPIVIDPLFTSPPGVWQAEGNQVLARFGSSLEGAGDVNGDGYDDVVIGAPYFDNGEVNEGRVYAYYGGASGISTTASWTAEADQENSSFGWSVDTAGDVNGDGYDDIIVGAAAYENGETNEGAAFVFHGSSIGLLSTAAWMQEGGQAEANFGYSVGAAGDVNGDGYGDVIVGAYEYDNGQTNEGRAFLYYGSADGVSSSAAWTAESDWEDADFGYDVNGAGDVNGDGYCDIVVGAPYYDGAGSWNGRAYLYYGGASGPSLTADWTCDGESGDCLGRDIDIAGDVNHDGYDDLIVGALNYDNGENQEGVAYAYYGAPSGLSTGAPDWSVESNQENALFGRVRWAGDVNGDGYDDAIVGANGYDVDGESVGAAFIYHGSGIGLSTTFVWRAAGVQSNEQFGLEVAGAGDVNGDGCDDVLVFGYDYANGEYGEGRALLYYGSSAGVDAKANWMVEGNAYYPQFGDSVGAAGDVNGDGYGDVIVGAPQYDNGSTVGRAYVYRGSASGLSTTESWVAECDQLSCFWGTSVGTAGDVNGDGYSDVIVGAGAYENGETDEGAAFVYHGSSSGLSTSANWMAESDQVDSSFGTSVGTAGDVNADGYADVIVGALGYDNGQTNEGAAFVYHGSSGGLSTTPDWMADGDQVDAWFGYSVALAGDVNGDGYSDVVVGALTFENGHTWEGAAFVYHGSGSGLNSTADWGAEGNQDYAKFGRSVYGAGDVNGDGYSDVIVGADYYDNGETNEGAAFVYHGSSGGLSVSADWMADGDQENALFGRPVGTAGDVNGDGYADVVIGAVWYDNPEDGEGAAFVYHGSSTGLSSAANWTGDCDQAGALFGSSAGTAGDVNGDGYSDLIVSALLYENGDTDEGAAFVYHGSPSGLNGSDGWSVDGGQESAFLGSSVAAAGDVNGDGYGDVIVGAYKYDNGETDEGRVFVYHGSPTGIAGTASDWSAESDQANSYFGTSVDSAGDVDNDGYDDVIIGAKWYMNGHFREGAAFVYHGSLSGLAGSLAWSAEGNQSQVYFGSSVGGAGDVNGDGYGDVIVGAPFYNGGELREGGAWVYHGGASGLATSASWSAESDQVEANFGQSVGTAGDVNGDGYSDVIVGAYYYDNGETNEGAAFVYHGSPTGLTAAADWSSESDQEEAFFGLSAGTAGDVNGDGYSDVIVGAYRYANGESAEGRAFVYHGSASGLPTAANWTAESDQTAAYFGASVGTAGDVNGDGYSDVIVGSYAYDDGESNEGGAFVYHGRASGLEEEPSWSAESDQLGAFFGYSVGTAGDVNGDGYADVIVGAKNWDNTETNEGGAFLYYGNEGRTLDFHPRQCTVGDDRPIARLGGVDTNAFRVAALARSSFGRGQAKLEWEAKPLGTPFDGTGTQQSGSWHDTGVGGSNINGLVSGLSYGSGHHWRARFLYHPARTPFQGNGRWFSVPVNGWGESDLRVLDSTDPAIEKSVDNSSPIEGDGVNYTLLLTNAGLSVAMGVVVTDLLPTGVTYVTHSGDGTYDSGTGLWSVGDLTNGQSASLSIEVDVDDGTAGWLITNSAAITAGDEYDTNPANNEDDAVINPVSRPLTTYASTTGTHVYPYTNWTISATNIQPAVDAVDDGGTVWVGDGTYLLTAQVTIDREVAVRSLNGHDAAVVDGNWNSRCFYLTHSNAAIRGFFITRGYTNYGGGVYCYGGSVESCTISNNQASYEGGGVYMNGGTVRNCRLVHNLSYGTGGGAQTYQGSLILNCTLAENSAVGEGGGVHCYKGGDLKNTILYGNSTQATGDNWFNESTGMSYSNCCTTPTVGTGCVTNDPRFVSDYTDLRLQSSSPCIDAGMALPSVDEDIDGAPRPLDGDASGGAAIDIGCYEYVSAIADTDGDGMADADEMAADTDPIDSASLLLFTAIRDKWTGTELEWIGGQLATQYLEYCPNLTNELPFWSSLFTNPPVTPVTNIHFTLYSTNDARRFFRIRTP